MINTGTTPRVLATDSRAPLFARISNLGDDFRRHTHPEFHNVPVAVNWVLSVIAGGAYTGW